jgi:hypothetical protein
MYKCLYPICIYGLCDVVCPNLRLALPCLLILSFLILYRSQKIGCSLDGQHVMTLDPSSRRYWAGGRHTKALHENGIFFGPTKKAIFVCYLERLGGFLTVVSHKNAGENQTLQLSTWGCNMKKFKEVCKAIECNAMLYNAMQCNGNLMQYTATIIYLYNGTTPSLVTSLLPSVCRHPNILTTDVFFVVICCVVVYSCAAIDVYWTAQVQCGVHRPGPKVHGAMR